MEIKNPKVSVIIPVFNTEKFLRQCVDSVLAQTYRNLDIILVDDGSTDSSGSICEQYVRKSAAIKVIHTSNRGLSAARNKGLDHARGEYITFVDSDDLIHPRFVELLMNTVKALNADISFCHVDEFKDEISLLDSFKWKMPYDSIADSLFLKHPPSPLKVAERMLYQKRKVIPSACGKIYRASLWKNLRFREGTGYEDLDIIPVVTLHSRIVSSIPLPMYYYRQHSGSYIHTFSLRRADVLTVTSRLSDYISRNFPSLLPAARDRQLSANFNIFGIITTNLPFLNGLEKKKALAIRDQCWRKIKELRGKSLLNPKVRIKNKAGILASYIGGKKLLIKLSTFIYKN